MIPLTAEADGWVNDTLNTMTLPQMVGQLLCASNPKFKTSDWLDLLEKVPLGALTVRGSSTVEARHRLQALQSRAAIPLLVAGDLEHGAVALQDATEFPWMMAAGAADDVGLMTQMGLATAAEARYAGLHLAFAPVVDLNYNFNNPITNIRAISDQPERVIRLATAFIQGLQGNGTMAATAKHFPGDGIDDRDQHLSTTINNLPLDQWQDTYGRVWRAVIKAGVMCIMVGHISLPAYQGFADNPGDALPATLSPKLVNDLLREELGFDGLLISDASGMVGLTSRISKEQQAVECIKSGLDLYLFPDTLNDYERLLKAVKTGQLSESRLREATRRVLEMKTRLNLHHDPFGPQPFPADMENFQQAAQSMADQSITILRADSRPPIKLPPGSHVLTVTIGQPSPFNKMMPPPNLLTFDHELTNRGFQVEHLQNPEDDILAEKAAQHDAVFVNLVALPYMTMGTIRNLVGHLGHWYWRSLFADHDHVCFTSFGNPYLLHEMPHLPNLLTAYGDSPVSQRSAVKVWLGEIEAKGTCPVRLPQVRIQPLST